MKSNVSTDNIKTYLRKVVELESSVYSLSKVRQEALSKISTIKVNEKREYDNKNSQLTRKTIYNMPHRPVDIPESYRRLYNEYEMKYSSCKENYMPYIILGIADVILTCMLCRMVRAWDGAFILIIGLGVIGMIIIYCIGGIKIGKVKSDRKLAEDLMNMYKLKIEQFEKDLSKYEKDKMIYDNEMAQANSEFNDYRKSYSDKMANLEQAEKITKQLDKSLDETKEMLAKIYDVGWIYPKYRNMVAMCTICEYFESGRVTTLEGADGAYNLYESELRQNLIISKLDTIISKLEQIKNNQYTLYIEVKKTNEMVADISQNIMEINKKTELILDAAQSTALATNISAYCLQAIEKNTEAIKYLNLIQG